MATYQVEWNSSALRELRRVDRQVISRIVAAVEALAEAPFPAGVRKLKSTDHTYRLRVGEYRVVYEVLSGSLLVVVIRVRHRRDAYRR